MTRIHINSVIFERDGAVVFEYSEYPKDAPVNGIHATHQLYVPDLAAVADAFEDVRLAAERALKVARAELEDAEVPDIDDGPSPYDEIDL